MEAKRILDRSQTDPDDGSRESVASLQERQISPGRAEQGHGLACQWCCQSFEPTRSDAKFCSRKCRQTAWRFSHVLETREANAKPKVVGYADPPYPGLAKKYYGDRPDYAGEVDHRKLIFDLVSWYDGWALSTSWAALREVLPLCPENVHVCAWVKPIGVSSKTKGLHCTWEALIVKPCRELTPGKRDFLIAQPAKGGGSLMGRKPIKFCAFLFEAIGALPGDHFDDIYPGSGIVSKCWREFCRQKNGL